MNKIGDMIYTIPLIKTLKNEFPEALITVLAEDTNAEIIKYEPYIDRVIVYKRDSRKYRNRFINIIKTLGGKDFDLAIGVKGGFSSFLAAASLLSGAQYKVGYVSRKRRFMNLFYNLPVDPIDFSSLHQVDACLNLLSAIGVTKEVKDISISIPSRFKAEASTFLKSKGLNPKERLVIFNISNNRETSSWGPDKVIGLGRFLIDKYRFKCIISGIPAHEDKALNICNKIGTDVFFFRTMNIMEFAAITSLCNLLVTGDGGASHVGAATGALVIALFGAADPVVWRPYGEQHIVLRQPDCDAKSITVQNVIAAIEANAHVITGLNVQCTG